MYLGTLFWNLNAFDSAASFAGEVRDPGRDYPRAMLAAMGIIVGASVSVWVCMPMYVVRIGGAVE